MIGIIGGTGLYKMEGLRIEETRSIDTPFGKPSAEVAIGDYAGTRIAFLPRHGSGHQLLPSEINYRANIWALKAAGVRRVLSVSAVGSLEHEVAPGDLAVPSQYMDWTKGRRSSTFFGDGMVAHVSTAEPACPDLTQRLAFAAESIGIRLHTGKAYACVEGPRLGTRVESFMFRNAGCHLVGMTNVPEVFLAREAQLCYCTVAIATDYDCWLDDPSQHASVEKVIELYMKNLERVKETVRALITQESSSEKTSCGCRRSLQGAVLTHESTLDEMKRNILSFLKE